MTELNVYRYGPKNGGAPKRLVVLLHGLGSDGRDLIGLAPYLAGAVPDALFLSPDAPYPCDMAPMGRQWFSLREWTHDFMLQGIKQASPVLDAFLDKALKDNGLDDSSLVLGGFSQGCMMSLYTGPRRKSTLAGILGYSGALVWERDVDSSALRKPPVHLLHGDSDDVVPVQAYYSAVETLERAGFAVTGGVMKGLPHSINEAGIESGGAFLRRVLS